MRKLVCLFAVAILAAPAFGGDVTFTVYDDGGSNLRIGYATADPCGPVGIGIKLTLTGACGQYIQDGTSVVSSSPEFNVHIDLASEDPCNYTVPDPAVAGANPLADPCAAGLPDPCVAVVSICMGRLDPCETPPSVEPCLVIINLGCNVEDCVISVDIEEDGLRGGIVGPSVTGVVMNDGTVVCGEPPDCPFLCWKTATQCHGDASGNGLTYTEDWSVFRDGFSSLYWQDPAATQATKDKYEANACADYDHNGRIYTADWPEFRNNFSSVTPVPTDCPGDCVWPPVWPAVE